MSKDDKENNENRFVDIDLGDDNKEKNPDNFLDLVRSFIKSVMSSFSKIFSKSKGSDEAYDEEWEFYEEPSKEADLKNAPSVQAAYNDQAEVLYNEPSKEADLKNAPSVQAAYDNKEEVLYNEHSSFMKEMSEEEIKEEARKEIKAGKPVFYGEEISDLLQGATKNIKKSINAEPATRVEKFKATVKKVLHGKKTGGGRGVPR